MNTSGLAFLDASSGEPLLPEAREAWLAAHDAGLGDVLRLHRSGRQAAQAVEQASALVAETVGARADEVVFVSSGTHACLAAVAGLARGRQRIGAGLVASAVEHSSVLAACDTYGTQRKVSVDRLGRIDLADWEETVTGEGVAAACLQAANQEVGTLQPLREAGEICARAGVPLVVDATPAWGRIPLTESGPWSVLTGWAGAFGGPPSVGIMIIRKGTRWRAPYPTDDYQSGRWPGPVDVAGIVAAAVALRTWVDQQREIAERQHRLIAELRAGLAATIPDLDLAGAPDERLPHLLTFSALYLDGETLTLELDKAGFAVASGSACSANSEEPSHVLAAMGALTHGNVRIGLTRDSDAEQVQAFLATVPVVVQRLRATLDV